MKTSGTKPVPPRWATRLLQWYCAPHLLEEVQGDLQEEFNYQVTHRGARSARLDYARNVLEFIKPFALKRKTSSTSTSLLNMHLYKHYLTVASRNVIRHKAFSAINITGLALGMSCCLLIFLWVRDEQRMDNFHTHGEALYTLYQTTYSNGSVSGGYAIQYNIYHYCPTKI